MPRKCIQLEDQPGFQKIHAPVLQQAIDRGLSGYSGKGVIDWGYEPEKELKTPPRKPDERTKERRQRKDFARGKDESWRANRVRRQFFEAEEVGNPKGMFAQLMINTLNEKGLDFVGRFLDANPLNAINWHGNKAKTSHFSVRFKDGSYVFSITMQRGRSKLASRTARHEFGHFVDYVLGLMMSKGTKTGLYFSDMFPDFADAFQKEIEIQGLEAKKPIKDTGKELLDTIVEELVQPAGMLQEQGLGGGNLNEMLSGAAGILDIADALTGGAWASRGFGGGHGIKYYKVDNPSVYGNPRLHETFANLFEAWSSNDKKAWERMSKYFPYLAGAFEEIMSIYGDPTTIFNSVNANAPTPTTASASKEFENPTENKDDVLNKERIKDESTQGLISMLLNAHFLSEKDRKRVRKELNRRKRIG